MKHIVFFSGGLGSFYTAYKVIKEVGRSNVELLFTDTLIEDEDLYRFIDESSEKLGVKLYKVADGRTPFDVYKDKKFLGNSRLAPCSHELKQKPAKKWLEDNYDPENCVLYLGIDWTEEHRTKAPIKNWKPYTVKFPLCEEPYVNKVDIIKTLEKMDIEIPRLYKMGFTHNNCGGFCCRAGQGHFATLLKEIPERYMYYENLEKEFREWIGKDVTMMTKMKDGKKYNYSLEDLRRDYEKENRQIDMFDVGGCGCFVE